MSNNAFCHKDKKVQDAMVIIAGVLHKRGPLIGHNRLKEAARKIRNDIYERPLMRLGKTPTDQRAVIEQALTLLVDRGLASFSRSTKTLRITKRGLRERELVVQARLQLVNA